MSDLFYKIVKVIGGAGVWVSANPTIVGLENIPRRGPFILASTHQSPFDVPLLMNYTPRLLDTVSIIEEFRKPILGWFYGSMNAFPLDRSRADPKTVRIVLDRLERGRVITIFPEGGIREEQNSVVNGGKIRPGIGRIAKIANVAIIPVILINSGVYYRPLAWAPLRRTKFGIMYGKPISPNQEPKTIEAELVQALVTQNKELSQTMAASRVTAT